MRALSASDLLRIWERGLEQGPIARAMELLAAAFPESGVETLAALTLGERDGLLLRLREATFGRRLAALETCAQCGENIELAFEAADLLPPPPEREAALALDGYQVVLRPPATRDLLAATQPDLSAARLELLEQCVISAEREGVAVRPRELPEAVIAAAEARLAEADPGALIELSAGCPACGWQRTTTFNIVAFFWREIEYWAQRMLREVHTLASAYGWNEEEILALTPMRRQCYLDLVGA